MTEQYSNFRTDEVFDVERLKAQLQHASSERLPADGCSFQQRSSEWRFEARIRGVGVDNEALEIPEGDVVFGGLVTKDPITNEHVVEVSTEVAGTHRRLFASDVTQEGLADRWLRGLVHIPLEQLEAEPAAAMERLVSPRNGRLRRVAFEPPLYTHYDRAHKVYETDQRYTDNPLDFELTRVTQHVASQNAGKAAEVHEGTICTLRRSTGVVYGVVYEQRAIAWDDPAKPNLQNRCTYPYDPMHLRKNSAAIGGFAGNDIAKQALAYTAVSYLSHRVNAVMGQERTEQIEEGLRNATSRYNRYVGREALNGETVMHLALNQLGGSDLLVANYSLNLFG